MRGFSRLGAAVMRRLRLKSLRPGLTMRLVLIFAVSFIALRWIAATALYVQSTSRAAELRLPLPTQVTSLVQLLEEGPKDWRPALLAAVNGPYLGVRVLPTLPPEQAPFSDLPAVRFRTDLSQRVIEGYLQALGPREVRVSLSPEGINPSWGLISGRHLISEGETVILIALSTGEALEISTRRRTIQVDVFGIPLGYWAGAAGVTVALLAILMVGREARPLVRLAQAVDQLKLTGQGQPPAPLRRRGAPEIRQVIDAFNRLQARLHRLLSTRMALIGGISHDLRTYATRLRLRVDLIEDDNQRDKAGADIDDMIRLIDDALLAVRSGVPGQVAEPVDLAALVEQEAEVRRQAGGVVQIRHLRATMVQGDRVALARVLANLTGNALAYGSQAWLSLDRAPDGGALLVVEDDGPGIPDGERERVLEPFVRLEASRNRATGGAGLGLSIANGLVEAHGGSLRLESAPGGGTRAVVHLPQIKAPRHEPPRPG